MIEFFEILSTKIHNIHYLKRYCKFISLCKEANTQLSDDIYTEKHHICPKSNDMFPEYEKNAPWNIIRLTVKQHLVAHHLLYKAYNNKSQTYAFWARVNIDGHQLTIKVASKLLENYRSSNSGINNHFYGKKHADPEKCGVQNIGKTPWNKGLSKSTELRLASGDKNYFFGKKFTKEKNPMFGKTTVYDKELNLFTTVTTEEYKLLKNIRYYNTNSTYVKQNVK